MGVLSSTPEPKRVQGIRNEEVFSWTQDNLKKLFSILEPHDFIWPQRKCSPLFALSAELLTHILGYLTPVELVTLGCTCKEGLVWSLEDSQWKFFVTSKFGFISPETKLNYDWKTLYIHLTIFKRWNSQRVHANHTQGILISQDERTCHGLGDSWVYAWTGSFCHQLDIFFIEFHLEKDEAGEGFTLMGVGFEDISDGIGFFWASNGFVENGIGYCDPNLVYQENDVVSIVCSNTHVFLLLIFLMSKLLLLRTVY